MANFRKRGIKWQAQVRRQGHPPQTRTFSRKSDAESWALQRESEIERDVPQIDHKVLRSITLGDLLKRYEATVSITKKGCGPEIYRLKAMQANAVATTSMDKLTTHLLASYRDERLSVVSCGTVRRELGILRRCLEVAGREWGVSLPKHPMAGLTMPPASRARERRVTGEEFQRLAIGLGKTRNPLVVSIINFAIATGMRRGEILGFTWGDVDLTRCVVHLRDTKNGCPRKVPLSPMALEVINSLAKGDEPDRVFPMAPNALRLSWERLMRRSSIVDLRLHDLRHEAISRFFEAGLSVPEVSLISGHKDPRMLFRYTHLRPENVATKLKAIEFRGVDLAEIPLTERHPPPRNSSQGES